MSISICQNNLGQLLNSPVVKWGAVGLAITLLVVGLLALTYGIVGFTPLAHSGHIFNPLMYLNVFQKIAVVVGGGVVAGVGILILIIFRKQATAGSTGEMPKFEFNGKSDPLEYINTFLSRPYKTKTEYYTFYYHLACMSESVQHDAPRKAEWESFLKTIDGRVIKREDGEHQIEIDCSVEFKRLRGQKTELTVDELTSDSPAQHISAFNAICSEAFENAVDIEAEQLSKLNRCFVIKEQQEILGCICLSERKNRENTDLFVHTLARRAPAVKLGMTEKFKEHLEKSLQEKKYTCITCEVYQDNTTAIAIYRKLGFRMSGYGFLEQATGKTVLNMHYDPSGEDKPITIGM